MRICLCVAVLCVAAVSGNQLHAQATGPAATPAVHTACKVNSAPPTAAEAALNRNDAARAEGLFREALAATPGNEAAHEGLVRALISQNKVADAGKEADAWTAASPASSMAMVAVADARLRQGSPRTALALFIKASQAEPCNPRAYYGIASVDDLAGRHATAKRAIEQAYALHPTDDDIHTRWISNLQRTERLAKWSDYVVHSDQISDSDRLKLKVRLQKESLYSPSDCRMAPTSPTEAKVPMDWVPGGWGLEVKFNGKGRHLQIDTGASGITISRAAAMFLGIQRQDQTEMGGVGDDGNVKTSIAHVASVKIGGIEFINCAVEILEKWSVVESDGLIGGDVFRDSLLTLDFPDHQLRISPLPTRPGETKPATSPNTAAEDQPAEPRDPYIAPEMANWQRLYRNGHMLLMPTGLVDTRRIKDDSAWQEKLFLLDSGAQQSLISPRAAAEVTNIWRDWNHQFQGISGQVSQVFEAGAFTFAFAGVRVTSPSMNSIETTGLSHSNGVEISGFIGAPVLYQLVMHIDYRDNLINFEHPTPKRW